METSGIIKKEDPSEEEETKAQLAPADAYSSVTTNTGKRQRKKKQRYPDELSDWDSCEEYFDADRERASSSNKRRKNKIDADDDADYEFIKEESVWVKPEPSDSSIESDDSQDLETHGTDGRKQPKNRGKATYKCHFCSYSTCQLGHFNVHVNERHQKGETFTCDHCDFTTNRLRVLTQHNLRHTGEKPHHCNLCDYKARLKANLTRHLRTHTGEKPFACKFCDYRCRQGYDLTKHIRIHTGEKPFACKLCDFKCATINAIKYHERRHHEKKKIAGKRYACDSCDVTFNSRKTVNAHRRKSHATLESSQTSEDTRAARSDNPLGLTDDDFIKVEIVEPKQELAFEES